MGTRARIASVALMLVGTSAVRLPSAMAVQILVDSGVSSVVHGTPAAGDPTFLWTTTPECSNTAGDELRPALINRASVAIASTRAIFAINPARPVGQCNPYELLSQVVSDEADLYYVDNQGPDGHAALWRRARTANPEDPSQFLADVGAGVTSAEIIVFGVSVVAILANSNPLLQPSIMVQYHKDTGELLNSRIDFGGVRALHTLRFDGRYLYWIKNNALVRNDTTNGDVRTVRSGPFESLYTEGFSEECDLQSCRFTSRILFGQDTGLFAAETISGEVRRLYTSPVPGGRITAILRGPLHYYFIERRPIGGGFDREDRFYRLGVGDTIPDRLYGPINNGGPGFDSFTTDFEWLYFRDRVAERLLRVEADQRALPVHDLAATGLEISQGLQNSANALRLIENKRTIVRFYVRSAIPTEDVNGVTATLAGVRAGGFLGRLEPVNAGGKLINVRANPVRENLDHSFQFELPLHWTSGGELALTATVNPAGRIVEDNLDNNSAVLGAVVFSPSPRLQVGFANFWYYIGGTLYQTTAAQVAASQRVMRRLYPVGEPHASFEGRGLHFTVNDFIDFGLGAHVTRTAEDCIDRYDDPAERNMCASDYVHGKLNAMRRTGAVRQDGAAYGNIPPAPAPMDLDYFTRGYARGQVGTGPSDSETYAAHEVGHLLKRDHPAFGARTCGHDPDDPRYPYVQARIENPSVDPAVAYAGLDISDTGVLKFLNGRIYSDIMSYCRPKWISDYTFNGMYAFLTSDAGAGASLTPRAVPGDWLILTGTLAPVANAGGFVEVRRVNLVVDASAPTPGGYTLELRNQAGSLLASHPFAPDARSEDPEHLIFDLVVPFVPGTTQLRVLDDATDNVLAARAVSAEEPLVGDVALPGAPEPVDGVVLVTWAASDPDGDDLRFDVLASVDGGQTHRAVALAIEDASINLDTSMLAGGTNQLRIVASDGVHTAFADSAPFTVPPRPPKIAITSPADGFQADWGQMITLEAEVSDLQDDFIPDDLVSWTGNLNGFFAIGRRVQIDQLPVGENVLQAHATNSQGASASASVTIVVGDRLVPRGPTISVAPTSIAWHVADEDPATQTVTLAVENAGSGSLQFDAASDADWVRLDSVTDVTDATAPRIFTITAAAALVMPGTTGIATLTLTNRSDPSDVVVVPVALSRGNVFDHALPASAPACPGDCNGNGTVSVDELVRGVNIALNRAVLSLCPAFDANADGQVFINELVSAVAAALDGC